MEINPIANWALSELVCPHLVSYLFRQDKNDPRNRTNKAHSASCDFVDRFYLARQSPKWDTTQNDPPLTFFQRANSLLVAF
jgi:hypothetical protein